MADNNLARSRNDVPDFFADGDPLAELARIVGYEDRVVANPAPAIPASVAANRRDPVFNLEDELLREFERYDAPRLDPVDDLAEVAQEQSVPQAMADEELVSRAVLPNSAAAEVPSLSMPQLPAEFFSRNNHAEEPAATEDWSQHQAVGEPAHAEPPATPGDDDDGFDVFSSLQIGEQEPEVELPLEVVPAVSPAAAEVVASAPVHAEPEIAFDDFDLAAELETSIVGAPAVQPASEMKRKGGFTPSFRMPLANFQHGAGVVSQHVPEAKFEPKFEPKADILPVPPVATPAPVSAPVAESLTPVVPAMDIPLAGPAEPVRVAEPMRAEAPAKDGGRFTELDALFYDVDRYSVAAHTGAPLAKISAPSIAPAASEVTPAPVAATAPVAEPVIIDELDPFADVEFELALDDLELDLADMVVEENNKIEAPAVAAPMQAVTQPVALPVSAAPTFAAPVMAAAVVAAPAFSNAPIAKDRAGETSADLDDDVAFDPALIAEPEEQPEMIAELDVPVLTVEERPEPVYRNDFDLDIDAELASLLEAPEAVAPQRAATEKQPEPAAKQAAGQPQSVYADLDDFERALEEDFRRSLATPLAADDRYVAAEETEQNVDVDQVRPSSRRWIAPLAAVGVLAICGASAYAWFGTSAGNIGGNGEPVVIAADSEPVKVAPANPGGKTVPNQDKAVYDRVAGAAAEAPKQQQLISSSEEPVDVVQKTLMPDTLPLEGEDDSQVADTGEAEDPRLLPQDQQQAVTVMPRKVKTMIVRADGTLVEQEVDPAQAGRVAAAATKSDLPAQSAPSQTAAPAQSAAAFPTAATAAHPAGVVPVSAPVGNMAGGASAMPATAQAPAAIEQLADTAPAASMRAPVPTARPSQQPVNVVASVSGQGNVRTPAAAAPAAPAAMPAAQNTQVASLGDGGYVIQVASLPSQADAQKSYQNLSNKFGSVIGGRGVDIKAAEIAGKGTFYRVRIPAGSKDQAVALCEKYRAAGGSCLVAR
jgi:hypothetical protein